jgi:hypothetical protein
MRLGTSSADASRDHGGRVQGALRRAHERLEARRFVPKAGHVLVPLAVLRAWLADLRRASRWAALLPDARANPGGGVFPTAGLNQPSRREPNSLSLLSPPGAYTCAWLQDGLLLHSSLTTATAARSPSARRPCSSRAFSLHTRHLTAMTWRCSRVPRERSVPRVERGQDPRHRVCTFTGQQARLPSLFTAPESTAQRDLARAHAPLLDLLLATCARLYGLPPVCVLVARTHVLVRRWASSAFVLALLPVLRGGGPPAPVMREREQARLVPCLKQSAFNRGCKPASRPRESGARALSCRPALHPNSNLPTYPSTSPR